MGSEATNLPECVTGWTGYAADRWVLDPEPYNLADLVVVDAFFYSRHKDHIQLGMGKPVQRLELDRQEVLAAYRLVGLGGEAIELQVDGGADVGEAGEEAVVFRDPDAVGVQHHYL